MRKYRYRCPRCAPANWKELGWKSIFVPPSQKKKCEVCGTKTKYPFRKLKRK